MFRNHLLSSVVRFSADTGTSSAVPDASAVADAVAATETPKDDSAPGIGHNRPPKYLATQSDPEKITAGLTQALKQLEQAAKSVESKGVPYLVHLCDFLATGGGKWNGPAGNQKYEPAPITGSASDRREACEKFLRDKGLMPIATNSVYTRNTVGAAIKIAVMVTDEKYPIWLGRRTSKAIEGQTYVKSTDDLPEGTHSEACVVTLHRVLSPKIRAGRDFVPNTNETLVPASFAASAKIYAELVKGKKRERTENKNAPTVAGALDATKAYGVEAMVGAMTETFGDKNFIPKPGEVVAAIKFATEVFSKVSLRHPGMIPAAELAAIAELQAEIETRLKADDTGRYHVMNIDGNGDAAVLTWEEIVERANETKRAA